MISSKQYVVCLSRLSLPMTQHAKRLTVSVCSLGQEQFIQNQKIVKANKVNFYRESIFIASLSRGLSFNVYSLDEEGHLELIHVFKTEKEDLQSINRRAALFHNSGQGYQLVWDCCLFIQDSEQCNDETDKDYTELVQPSTNEEGSLNVFSNERSGSQLQTKSDPKCLQNICKRSNSTLESNFHKQYPKQISESTNRHKRRKTDKLDHKSVEAKRRINMKDSSDNRKRSVNVKSLVFSSLITGITGMFRR